MFGPAVTIATVGHPIHPGLREYMYCDHVTIGNNCWIGANSVICPGVTIGESDMKDYYRDRPIIQEDLAEERRLREK